MAGSRLDRVSSVARMSPRIADAVGGDLRLPARLRLCAGRGGAGERGDDAGYFRGGAAGGDDVVWRGSEGIDQTTLVPKQQLDALAR